MNFLIQSKLSKEEWNKIEIPLSDNNEKQILKMIDEGFNNNNYTFNSFFMLREVLKLDKKADNVIFIHTLEKDFVSMNKKGWCRMNQKDWDMDTFKDVLNKKIKKSINTKDNISKKDEIKLNNTLNIISQHEQSIIELIIMKQLKSMHKNILRDKDKDINFHYYNIHYLLRIFGDSINQLFYELLQTILTHFSSKLDFKLILKNVPKFIEHNKIHNYKKYSLYKHQKDIFSYFNSCQSKSKLVFYCAPTSSGKTLTPIGLTNKYKVIFVCASKHIGLNLAKNAFNVKKKIGFAFGCNSTQDIRINYNAVVKYTTAKNGKKLADHSVGNLVEIMISDVISYKHALDYMKSFNSNDKLLLFWDEPTIGLDVTSHYLHNIIHENWSLNDIPNVVLSCATLPKREYIQPIFDAFENKFEDSNITYIETYDQETNLCIYDDMANILMPHMYFKSLSEIQHFLSYHGKKYYKFLNCNECMKFLLIYNKYVDKHFIKNTFQYNLDNVTMFNIKDKYVSCILSENMTEESWNTTKHNFELKYPLNKDNTNLEIGPNLTTEHSYTLTNGPTLYITDNTEKVCKYLLLKSGINKDYIENMERKMYKNKDINVEINKKQKEYDDKIEKIKNNENMMKKMRLPPAAILLNKEIEKLKTQLYDLQIESVYKPNTRDHYSKWCKNGTEYSESDVYLSHIGNETITNILNLTSLSNLYKFMILLGIGIFSNTIIQDYTVEQQYMDEETRQNENEKYIEIIKQLAEEKSLYLILGNSDYIYGTNYQFSHCYLGKDMKNMTQEKIIQCVGRVGRQVKNKHFSFRFRSYTHIDIFYSTTQENTIEVTNMNNLFV